MRFITYLIAFILLASTASAQFYSGGTAPVTTRSIRPSPPGNVSFRAEPPVLHTAAQDHWDWTPDAEHHKAINTIQIGNAGGTATYFKTNPNETQYIVTCGHIGRGSGTITWWDGSKANIRPVFVVNQNLDMAVFSVDRVPAGTTPIPLSFYAPPVGAVVEVCGYGGPGSGKQSSLRHFKSTVLSYTSGRSKMTAPLLSGDSGGPVIYEGKIVGINNGGNYTKSFGLVGSGGDWKLHYPALTTTAGPIWRMLRWAQPANNGQICGPNGCPPSQPQYQGGGGGGLPNFVPPAPTQPVQPTQPITPLEPVDLKPDTAATDSLKAEIAELKELIKAIPTGPAGAPGKTGDSGPAGKDGSDATVKPFMVYVYKNGKLMDSGEVDLMSDDPDKRDIHIQFYEE